MTTMMDEKSALLRAHRNNINRYRRLLGTDLTELERRFIEKRVSEEQKAIENIAASTSPAGFRIPPRAIVERSLSDCAARYAGAQAALQNGAANSLT
jgi:hypothetical protein